MSDCAQNPSAACKQMLDLVDSWDMDVFALAGATGGQPLAVLGMHILRRRGLVRALGLDEVGFEGNCFKCCFQIQSVPSYLFSSPASVVAVIFNLLRVTVILFFCVGAGASNADMMFG